MNKPAMNTKSKILPTIHLNGSSAQCLTDDYSHARRAVQEAITALKAVDFNARDYYVHSNPAAWMQAVRQREEIYQHLSDAFNALHEHELHCSQFIK
jgi:phosphoribosylformylglycinamidine (FGAM) synthase-like enzyme